MSAILSGAVWGCGPNSRTLRPVLAAIADNADDFGFACPSIATIAAKVCCSERTAMRMVQELEQQQWVRVCRKAMDGKFSVYFINLEKLGVTENPKMRRSQLHVEIAKKLASKPDYKFEKSGDKLSPEVRKSGDNPQGSQVTKTTESGDKTAPAILKNRKELLLTETKNPPTPLAGGERADGWTEEQNLAFEAEQRVNWEDCNRMRGKLGDAPLRWEDFVAEAYRHRPAPPPPKLDAEFQACQSAEDAARLLMRRECIAQERLVPVITQALELHVLRSRLPVAEVGYLAWRNYRSYSASSGSMRYSWGPRKLFAEGHVWNPGSWPVDSKPMRL